jgi:hypothetical protein
VPVPSALRSSCFLVDPFNFILKSVPFSEHSFADFQVLLHLALHVLRHWCPCTPRTVIINILGFPL